MTTAMPRLERRVALVTGATAGIGRAVALRLAQDGAAVVLTGRDASAGTQLESQISSLGGRARFFALDLENGEDCRAKATEAAGHFGGLDIVVASAGASSAARGLFSEIDPEAVAQQVARTVRIKLNPVHAALPHLMARGGGAVLFITSEGGRVPTPGQTAVAYHSAGLIGAARVMAKELSRHHIRVNTLCITLVRDTPIHERYAQGGSSSIRQKVYDRIASQAPFGLASPEEIASTAAFLVSSDAGHVTGATLSATGGASFA